MIYILYTVFFISCLALVVSVLLQPGKTDAGALFTSNISGNAFGPRGTQTVLSKLTITAAVCFMLSALFISLPAFSGTSSVLANNPDSTSETATTPPISNLSNANTDSNAPANSSMGANTAVSNSAPVADTAANVNTAVPTANINKTSAPVNAKPANAAPKAAANANKK